MSNTIIRPKTQVNVRKPHTSLTSPKMSNNIVVNSFDASTTYTKLRDIANRNNKILSKMIIDEDMEKLATIAQRAQSKAQHRHQQPISMPQVQEFKRSV